MPITVTGGRELVDGGWSHAGLHTTLTPGPNTELDGAVSRGYQRLPIAWETETEPSLVIRPTHSPQFTVDLPINRPTWPIVKSIAFYNGAGAGADILGWLPFAIGRLPSNDPVQPTLTIDRDLVDIISMGDFAMEGFTAQGQALLYGGRVFNGYLALHTGAPTTANEIDGAGYARVEAGSLLGLSAEPTEVVVQNTARVRWAPSATWDAPTHLALWSDQPRGAGDLWWSKAIPLPGPTSPRLVPNANAFYDFDIGTIEFDFGLAHRVGFIADSDKRLSDAPILNSRLESSITAPSRRAVAVALESLTTRGITEGALEGLLVGLLEGPEPDTSEDIPPDTPELENPIRLYRFTDGTMRYHGLDIGGLQIRWGFVDITVEPDPDYIIFKPSFSERCDYCHVQWGGHITFQPGETFENYFSTTGSDVTINPPGARVIIDNEDRTRAAVYTTSGAAGHMFFLAFGR